MTDRPESIPALGPMHPATRVGRVLQQLRSLTTLHARELDEVARQLESIGNADLATRLRSYQNLHVQEITLAVNELEDIGTGLEVQRHQSPLLANSALDQES